MYAIYGLPTTTRSGYKNGVVGNRIKELRRRRGISAERLAEMLRSGRSTIVKLERGEMRLSTEWMDRIGSALAVEPCELLASAAQREIPVEHYVGAGGEVHPIEKSYLVNCPRGLDPDKTAAIEIRGDSLLPLEHGWVLFHTKMIQGVDAAAIGHLSVVKIAGGPMLIRHLRRGYQPGRYNLVSPSTLPLEDVTLEWAARVRAAAQRDLVATDAPELMTA